MTDRELPKPRFTELHEVQQEGYRAICGLAVAGLVLGLLSIVALVDYRAAAVAAAGAVVSALALWQIARRSPELTGRKAAVAGLVLSLAMGGVAVGHVLAYRWLLTRQSREVARAWFDLMATGQPQAAYQFHLPPADRQPSGSDLWRFYQADATQYEALNKYVASPGIRALLALGKNVTIRPYAIESVDTRSEHRKVTELYSATYEHDGRKTTFLVRMTMKRQADDAAGRAVWQILNAEGGARPEWEGDPYWISAK